MLSFWLVSLTQVLSQLYSQPGMCTSCHYRQFHCTSTLLRLGNGNFQFIANAIIIRIIQAIAIAMAGNLPACCHHIRRCQPECHRHRIRRIHPTRHMNHHLHWPPHRSYTLQHLYTLHPADSSTSACVCISIVDSRSVSIITHHLENTIPSSASRRRRNCTPSHQCTGGISGTSPSNHRCNYCLEIIVLEIHHQRHYPVRSQLRDQNFIIIASDGIAIGPRNHKPKPQNASTVKPLPVLNLENAPTDGTDTSTRLSLHQ